VWSEHLRRLEVDNKLRGPRTDWVRLPSVLLQPAAGGGATATRGPRAWTGWTGGGTCGASCCSNHSGDDGPGDMAEEPVSHGPAPQPSAAAAAAAAAAGEAAGTGWAGQPGPVAPEQYCQYDGGGRADPQSHPISTPLQARPGCTAAPARQGSRPTAVPVFAPAAAAGTVPRHPGAGARAAAAAAAAEFCAGGHQLLQPRDQGRLVPLQPNTVLAFLVALPALYTHVALLGRRLLLGLA